MKILHFTDLHLSERIGLSGGNVLVEHDGQRRRRSLVDGARFLDWLCDRVELERPDWILFGGDLFDRARPTPNEYVVAATAFRRLSRVAPVTIIKGNHDDSSGHDSPATDVIRAFEEAGDGRIQVVDRPEVVEQNGVTVYCLPYPPLGQLVERGDELEAWSKEFKSGMTSNALGAILDGFATRSLDELEADRATILLSHVTFAGAEYSQGQVVPMTDVGAPTSRLGDFSAVAAGHLHLRQRIAGLDSAWYTGATDRIDHGDAGNPTGVAWLTANGNRVDWQFEEYPRAREFITIEPGDLLKWGASPAIQPDAPQYEDGLRCPERAIVRVKGAVDDLEFADKVERMRDDIASRYGALTCELEVEANDDEVTAVEPGGGMRAIFDAYLEARPDAIPEQYRDEVFAAVESLTTTEG